MIAAIAGMFPAIAMKLLDFVALYGLVLMPMGAVIFVDFWLAGKFGFERNYAEKSGVPINWAAAIAWVATLAACLAVVNMGGMQIYFIGLPGWFAAAALYIVMSRVLQRKEVRL
jgi:cytosine/uracil/thiamine/allantoin permease